VPAVAPGFVGAVKRDSVRRFALIPLTIRLLHANRPQISLDVSPKRSDGGDDCNPVKEKST